METKRCYAVLWIPTYVHKSFIDHWIQERICRNISDIKINLRIEAVLQIDNKNIDINIFDEKGERHNFLTLYYYDHSRNGLVEYYYDEYYYDENNPDGFRFTSDTFPEAVYHIIKEFYHKHEFHENENDTSLPPFTSDQPINLKENDNPALKHYLERYENALTDLVRAIQNARDSIANKNEKNILKKIKRYLKNYLNNYRSYGKIIMKAKGYEVFLNALYGSVYNTQCKIKDCQFCQIDNHHKQKKGIPPSGITFGHFKNLSQFCKEKNRKLTKCTCNDIKHRKNLQRDMRRRAFNIENLIKYFNACGQEYNINVLQCNLMEHIKNSWFALIVTFISTLIGLFFTIRCSLDSSNELQQTKTEVINTVETKIDSVKSWISEATKVQTDGAKSDKTAKQTNQPVKKKSK